MKPYRILLFVVAATFLASCAKEPLDQNVTLKDDGSYENDNSVYKGWVRVKLSDDAQPLKVGAFTRGAADSGNADLDKLAADLGATEIRRVFTPNERFEKRHRAHGLHLWFDIKFDESVPVSRARGQFEALPQIAVVEPVYRIVSTDGPDYIMPARDGYTVGATAQLSGSTRAAAMPFDDPELKKQWHYNNDGSIGNSVAGADINLFKAWEKFGAGDPSVIVCVMDNAVQADHPDLAANMWVNTGEIPDNGIDDDGNGFIDDVNGWDFYERTPITTNIGSHGTHVAGTVAAVNNNGIGVCGVAGGTGNGDGVRIMTTAIYNVDGGNDDDKPVTDSSIDSYIYAADNGAVISQNSWNIGGMNPPKETPQSLADAFEYFIKYAGVDENDNQVGPMRGGVIIFAAGNTFSGYASTPSNYPGVICVSSMMPNYVKASYSNFGTEVALFAPGGSGLQDPEFSDAGKVYSTDLNGGYGYKSGTSMACPHASGVAAIIVSKFGGQGFTNKDLKQRLLSSVRNVSQYQTNPDIAAGLGAGLLDASLIDMQNPDAAPDKPTGVTVTSNSKVENELVVTMTVTADANGMYIAGFNVSYAKESDKNDQSKWSKKTLANNFNVGATKSLRVDRLEDATDYIFRVSSYDRFGNESEYVEAKGRTIDHINRSPIHTAIINPVSFPIISGAGKSFETTLDLTNYFSDPDLPNDELTYSAESRDNAIVSVSVDGSILTIKGLKKGNTSIVVYCTDRGGLKINKGVAIKVLEDVSGSVGIIKAFEPVNFPMTQNGVQVYETSFELKDYFSGSENDVTYSVLSSGSSIASAELKNGSTMVIKGVANGNAVVTVKATSNSGDSVSQTVAVSVTGKTVAVGNKLSVYPNPVVDVAKLSVSGAGNANAQMRIYDSASRVVKRGDISFAGDVMQAYDMTSLAPGVYTMVVNVAGKEYKNTFVKK